MRSESERKEHGIVSIASGPSGGVLHGLQTCARDWHLSSYPSYIGRCMLVPASPATAHGGRKPTRWRGSSRNSAASYSRLNRCQSCSLLRGNLLKTVRRNVRRFYKGLRKKVGSSFE